MNNFFIILFHTYLSKFKTKSFMVTTIITAVIMLALANMTNIIDFFNKDGADDKIAVIDETGQLYVPLKEQIKAADKDIVLEQYDGNANQAKKEVEEGNYKGLLELSLNKEGLPAASYKAMSIADSTVPADLQASL
ncbi:MAG: ABC transporter permease, partial [Mesobacillus sp.]|uniref:ABC transporter permease n=1 Tax=Mesobacillus sp. TaxID=2675271 RepID=UPI003C3E2BE5